MVDVDINKHWNGRGMFEIVVYDKDIGLELWRDKASEEKVTRFFQ